MPLANLSGIDAFHKIVTRFYHIYQLFQGDTNVLDIASCTLI